MQSYLTVCATIRDLNTALGITSLCSMASVSTPSAAALQHHAAELMRSVVLLGCGLMPLPLVVLA